VEEGLDFPLPPFGAAIVDANPLVGMQELVMHLLQGLDFRPHLIG
jgi:hypothetical protein